MVAFQGSVSLVVRPSRRARLALAATHALAGMTVLCAYPLTPACAVLLAVLAADAWRAQRRLGRHHRAAISALTLDRHGRWRVLGSAAPAQEAVLTHPPFVSADLIALSLRGADGRERHVLLLADNAAPEAVRRLRVRLLQQRGAWSGVVQPR